MFNTKRGGSKMGNLSEELMAELNCETAFTIPIFGGIPVADVMLLLLF